MAETSEPSSPSPKSPNTKWRGQRNDPTERKPKTRKGRQLFFLAALMLALVGTALAIFLYPNRMVPPAFVTLSVREYESPLYPPNAWAVQDGQMLTQRFTSSSASVKKDGYSSQIREQFDKALRGLETIGEGAVVIHICALSRVNAEGQVVLLPGDANPDDPGRWIPLREVLTKIGDCRAENKLLLLDIMRPIADVRLGVLADDVSDHVHSELERTELPFFVLTACSKGQKSHVSEELGSSVFAYYFDLGMRGFAEGIGAQGSKDHRVFVHELADYLQTHVDRWVWMNRGLRQTPTLYGKGKRTDFALVQMASEVPKSPEPVEPSQEPKYPTWLKAGWKMRDASLADGTSRLSPRLLRQLELALVRAEKRWRSGIEEDRLKRDLDFTLEPAKEQFKTAKKAVAYRHVSLAGKDDGKVEALFHDYRSGFSQLLALTAEPGIKIDDAEKAKVEMLKKIRMEIVEKLKKQTFEDGAGVIIEIAKRTQNLSPGKLLALSELLVEIRMNAIDQSRYVETVYVDRLKDLVDRVRENDWDWPTQTAYQSLRVNAQAEAVLVELGKDPATLFPWNENLWAKGETQRRHGEKDLFEGMDPSKWKDSLKSLAQAEQIYRQIPPRIEVFRQMHKERDRALLAIPGWGPYLIALNRTDAQEDLAWAGSVQSASNLIALIDQQDADILSGEPTSLLQLRGHLAVWQRVVDARLHRLLRIVEQGEGNAQDYQDIHALLESTRLDAELRESLWKAARKLGLKLHQTTADLDFADPRPALASVGFGEDATSRLENERKMRRVRLALDFLAMTPYDETEAVVTQANEVVKSNDAKLWSSLAGKLRDVYSKELPGKYRKLTASKELTAQNLGKADRLSRITPGLELDRQGLADTNPVSRNPAFALDRLNRVQFWDLLRERYQAEGRALETRKCRHAPFYVEAAENFLGNPP